MLKWGNVKKDVHIFYKLLNCAEFNTTNFPSMWKFFAQQFKNHPQISTKYLSWRPNHFSSIDDFLYTFLAHQRNVDLMPGTFPLPDLLRLDGTLREFVGFYFTLSGSCRNDKTQMDRKISKPSASIQRQRVEWNYTLHQSIKIY